MGDSGRSEAGQEGRNVAGVGDGEGAGRAVVIEGKAEKFGGKRVAWALA